MSVNPASPLTLVRGEMQAAGGASKPEFEARPPRTLRYLLVVVCPARAVGRRESAGTLFTGNVGERAIEGRDSHLSSLEGRTRRLERRLRLAVCGWLLTFGVLAVSAWTWQPRARPADAPTPLRVSELVVVDAKGVERVRIGGDLPDALIGGRRVPRGERAAGVLLYDGSGHERSGYVTFEPSGNVGLTLDTRRGQVAYFVAGPDSGSALQL